MERECIFCRTLLDDECRSKYVCTECEYKMNILKQINKVDKATDRIAKARNHYLSRAAKYTYEDERYKVANKIINDRFRFNSTEEVCVALQCEKDGIKYHPNYKVGNYYVDFIFPELNVIFEVDGELYHRNDDADFIRERGIMHTVGEKYEIVRLPATDIPNLILLNFREAISHVIFQRNFNQEFRDTRKDRMYFIEFLNLASHMRRNK